MKNYILESIETKKLILQDKIFIENIEKSAEILVSALKSGKKVLFAGNGGSAGDCNHLSTELVSKFCKERKALAAISLTSNNSTITAIANDYGFEKVFSRQVEALGQKGDVFIAMSTSGNSQNVVEVLKTAKKLGITTIGFGGQTPSDMDIFCDVILKVPSSNTPIIQESHIMLGHLICKLVEERIS